MNWLLLFVRRPNLWAENIVFYDEILRAKEIIYTR
jgi:MoxR-like ATPase